MLVNCSHLKDIAADQCSKIGLPVREEQHMQHIVTINQLSTCKAQINRFTCNSSTATNNQGPNPNSAVAPCQIQHIIS